MKEGKQLHRIKKAGKGFFAQWLGCYPKKKKDELDPFIALPIIVARNLLCAVNF
jgi:hypothetical protein